MRRIGLTGSMATGKTTVLATIAALGVPTYSADAAVHDLYQGEAVPLIAAAFPGTIVNGKVDRSALGAALAVEPQRLAELEAIIHPLVRGKGLAFFDKAEQDGADLAVMEIPLLFETGVPYPLDTIIVTACTPEIQRQRAMGREGMTEEKLALLLARQLGQDEKKKRADIVIDTSGTIEQTQTRTRAAIARLRQTIDQQRG